LDLHRPGSAQIDKIIINGGVGYRGSIYPNIGFLPGEGVDPIVDTDIISQRGASRSGPVITFNINPGGVVAFRGVADQDLTRCIVIVDTMVPVPIEEITYLKISTGTRVVRDPGVFIGIGDIVQDGIVDRPAAIEANSTGIPLVLLGVGERNIVTDQVIVGTTSQVDTMVAVVMGDVPADG